MQPQVPKPQKPLKAQLSGIWDAIRRHPYMKLSALLIAAAFWAVVIASDPSLLIEKTITGATVAVQGAEPLKNRSYIVTTDLTSKPITVKMRVKVKASDVNRVTAESFSPQVNLAQITGAGKQKVKVTAAYTNLGTVVSFEPEFIEVDVEPYTSRPRIPLTVEMQGAASESVWLGEPSTDLSQVTVNGPESLVRAVRRAVVTLPLSGLSAERPEDSIASPIELRDENNQPIVSPLLRISSESINVDSARISVSVYPMRDIPVSLESAVVGSPSHGYTLGDVRVSPATVKVAAPQDVLDTIDALHVVNPIDISDQQTSQVHNSSLRRVDGVVNVSVGEVVVEADVIQAKHVHTYGGLPVTVMGLGEGLSARLSRSEMSVVITGDYQSVEPLTSGSIHLFVDATGLSEGVHTVMVDCSVDGTDAFAFTPEVSRLTLTLTKTAVY